jgi:hypothetical protein
LSNSVTTGSWIPYAPALVITLMIFVTAGIFGGPIAVGISAMFALPALLTSYVLTYITLVRYAPPTRVAAIGLGFGVYVLSAILVIISLSLYGPSQIM